MIRLTLRTLLAYLDDTLPPSDAKVIGQKLAENEDARQLAERIRILIRKRSLSTPATGAEGSSTDPNVVAAYLSDSLSTEMVEKFEKLSLESDVSLAELAACHQILTLLLSDQVRVPPSAYKRMYGLVKGKESIPGRTPGRQSLPVGGVNPADKLPEADDTDAAYLLGMPAYSKNEPVSRKVMRWAVAGLLACGFFVAAALAWWNLTVPQPNNAIAAAPTDKKEGTTLPTGKIDEPKKEDPKKEEPKKEDPKKEDVKKEEEPKKEDPMKEDPKKEESKKEDLGQKQPPSDTRLPIGVSDTGDEQILVVKKSAADGWERVKKGAELQSTDRLVCLPGYRAKVQLKGGVAAELWANVPGELLPMPVAETSITPHVPPEKFDADFTLHAGRVYLSNTLDRAALMRVRVRDPKFPVKDVSFDITLSDKTTDLVIEVQHALNPGACAEPPRTATVFHALKGTASLPLKGKTTTISTGDVLVFDSVKGVADGPKKQDEKAARGLTYFEREAVYENPDKSRATLKALRQMADRLKDGKAVPAAVAEQRADPTAAVDLPVFFAGATWSVFATAALGDVAELIDLLNDPNRQGIRIAAITALRGLLAGSCDKIDAVRTIAKDRWKLSAVETDAFLDTVAGIAETKLKDKDALTKLAEQLNADTVAQREAAMFVLLTEVDPMAQARPELVIDVAGSADKRSAAVTAWKKRIVDLTKETK